MLTAQANDLLSSVAASASLVVQSAQAVAQAALDLTAQAPRAVTPAVSAPAPDLPGAAAQSVPAPADAAHTPITVRAPVTLPAAGLDAAPQPPAAPTPVARTEGGPDRVAPAQVPRSASANRGSTADGAARPTPQPSPSSRSDDPDDAPTPRSNDDGPDPTPADPCFPDEPAGYATSAAAEYSWGKPNRVEDFDGSLDKSWGLYDGPGHGGKGRRTPDAVTVKNGVMTITGDPSGNTEGMAWDPGQKYGRWEGRVKAPAGDRSYHALLLLWPDAENWPVGGEVDFMEMSDHTRQTTDMFLHYGRDNSQLQGSVKIDATQWHNWAVEWTPDHIAAFVDGKQWWRTDNPKALPPGPMHLCIQLDWFPRGGDGDVQTSHMYVDWVRQYSLNSDDPSGGKPGDGSGDASGDRPGDKSHDGSRSEGRAVSAKPGLVPTAVPTH